jgi:hypothetical protein
MTNTTYAVSETQQVQEPVQHHGGSMVASQISPRLASPMISSPQQLVTATTTVTLSARPWPSDATRQSSIVLVPRTSEQVYNGGQIVTTCSSPAMPTQTTTLQSNQVKGGFIFFNKMFHASCLINRYNVSLVLSCLQLF